MPLTQTNPAFPHSRFRNSFTARAGHVSALVVQCRIVNINLANWTVGVRSQYDRHFWHDIQVAAPYLHFNNGEGSYCFPEVGAVCMVTIPSDSSAPFVSAFIMPPEFTDDSSSADAPDGTASHGMPSKTASAALFGGGRPAAKPGDIVMRTRDGNFVILHRGGVLQIGATELAQRIFIPLSNMIMDVSQSYVHHNAGGSVVWALSEGPKQDHIPTQHMETFRVFADDEKADIRITKGKCLVPLGEPEGDDGEQSKISEFELGTTDDGPIIYEVAVSKTGFSAESGQADDATPGASVFRFFFDRDGGTFLRCQGNTVLSVKKKFHIHVTEDFTIQADKNMTITCGDGLELVGGEYAHVKGDVVRLGAGVTPIARQGEIVTVTMPPSIIPVTVTITGTVTSGAGAGGAVVGTGVGVVVGGVAYGVITSGNSKVLA